LRNLLRLYITVAKNQLLPGLRDTQVFEACAKCIAMNAEPFSRFGLIPSSDTQSLYNQGLLNPS